MNLPFRGLWCRQIAGLSIAFRLLDRFDWDVVTHGQHVIAIRDAVVLIIDKRPQKQVTVIRAMRCYR